MSFRSLPHPAMTWLARLLLTAGLAVAPVLRAGPWIEPDLPAPEPAPQPTLPSCHALANQILQCPAMVALFNDYDETLTTLSDTEAKVPAHPPTHAALTQELGALQLSALAGVAVEPMSPLKVAAFQCYSRAAELARGFGQVNGSQYQAQGGDEATFATWNEQLLATTLQLVELRLIEFHPSAGSGQPGEMCIIL